MQVLQIIPTETVQVDQDRLSTLYSQLGESSAEDVVCRALEELAVRLNHCETLFSEHRDDELRKNARTLIAIADQIGMKALSQVASDVTTCVDRGDYAAQAATVARLLRVGERSLTAVWNLPDIPV